MTPQRTPEPKKVRRSLCIPWTGHRNPKGYGFLIIKRKIRMAHRVLYEGIYGKIPEGMQVDHLCRNRACVNPHHLEIVTNRVNVLRGIGHTAVNARKTNCINGHKNWKHVKRSDGTLRRECIDCKNRNNSRWWFNKKRRQALSHGKEGEKC